MKEEGKVNLLALVDSAASRLRMRRKAGPDAHARRRQQPRHSRMEKKSSGAAPTASSKSKNPASGCGDAALPLSGPLAAACHEAAAQCEGNYALCIHYGGHASKKDRLQMSHAKDIGYELQSSLLVDAQDGNPFSVAAQNLVSAVALARKAQPKRVDAEGKRETRVAGVALAARLAVSKILNPDGDLVAQWYLLSNVSGNVDDAQLALRHCFRRQIATFFRLIKGAGHQLES